MPLRCRPLHIETGSAQLRARGKHDGSSLQKGQLQTIRHFLNAHGVTHVVLNFAATGVSESVRVCVCVCCVIARDLKLRLFLIHRVYL